MKVELYRNETSKPIVYENVINLYTKGNMYCIYHNHGGEEVVDKYPICSIFRVRESYV